MGYYLDKKPVVDRSKLMAFIKGGKQVQQKQKQKQKVRGEQSSLHSLSLQSSYNPTIFLQSSYKPVPTIIFVRALSQLARAWLCIALCPRRWSQQAQAGK